MEMKKQARVSTSNGNSSGNGNSTRIATVAELRQVMSDRLKELEAVRSKHPLMNPVRHLSLDLADWWARGDVDDDTVESLVQHISFDAFMRRGKRLLSYIGEVDRETNRKRICEVMEHIVHPEGADSPVPFERYKAEVERAGFGIVLTAHPTFGLSRRLRRIMVELATGQTEDGEPLSDAGRDELLFEARSLPHMPDPEITLDDEHEQAEHAIEAIQNALLEVRKIALEVAARHYPARWKELNPTFMTVASWVGYDLDGRTDIGWQKTLEKRIGVAASQMERILLRIRALKKRCGDPSGPLATTLSLAESRLTLAHRIAEEEASLFNCNGDESQAVRALSERMVENDSDRLTSAGEIVELLDRAVAQAQDDGLIRDLAVLRSDMAAYGLATADTHVRLNSTQIHNAVRHATGMDSAPDDPGSRRRYMNALSALLDRVEPVTINFGSLMAERATARRLFMIVRQMLKYADHDRPVRFLIAESDTPFTVLAALYFARLFGVDDRVDISPLFETPNALERGADVIAELLENRHYRAYVRKRGRLAIQTGFSDAGRFLGQIAAALAIERLHMKLARLLAARGMTDIEVVIFDTHGESIGRGAHPVSMAERLRYLSSPASRELFIRNGIPLKNEVSFQGGDGFSYFETPDTAFATVCRIVEHMFSKPMPAEDDPFYEESDHTLDFFLTVTKFNTDLMNNPDYGALIGSFGQNLLYPTGSRRLKRQHDVSHGVDRNHPSQIRAIPHNAILQQLGWLANTVGGTGGAIAHDIDWFVSMHEKSPRLRQMVAMVARANELGNPDAFMAYAGMFDPDFWMAQACSQNDPAGRDGMRRLARILDRQGRSERTGRVVRLLIHDALDLREGLEAIAPELPVSTAPEDAEAARIDAAVLHAIRLTILRRIFILAVRIPRFSSTRDVTLDDLVTEILELDVPGALDVLEQVFPADSEPLDLAAFGEPASYQGEDGRDYMREHVTLFQPLRSLYSLMRRSGTAIAHMAGAHG